MNTTYVEGLREMVRALERLGTEAQDLKEAFTRIGDMVASDARGLVPKGKTGRLAASIKPTKTKNKAAVRVGSARVPYAGVIEYGWPRRNITARPYLKTAIDSNQTKALQLMEDELNRLIQNLNLEG